MKQCIVFMWNWQFHGAIWIRFRTQKEIFISFQKCLIRLSSSLNRRMLLRNPLSQFQLCHYFPESRKCRIWRNTSPRWVRVVSIRPFIRRSICFVWIRYQRGTDMAAVKWQKLPSLDLNQLRFASETIRYFSRALTRRK